ncbi:hypothetical protein GJ744_005616 [Endocarpon pusillum]|uniref:Uncharacterized protein n=1 Tax=Endocarpon pusillum TaxID=364733 RepID=A0A8H7A701_9EURO|nr:hypothetical protein GJ744_005616 [Endocarpon pusillum]
MIMIIMMKMKKKKKKKKEGRKEGARGPRDASAEGARRLSSFCHWNLETAPAVVFLFIVVLPHVRKKSEVGGRLRGGVEVGVVVVWW